MTNKELFVNAFIEAEKIEYTGFLDKSFFTFEFSPKFEKKMSKLISKEHRIKFSTRRKISKSLIAAVVAIIVMFTGLMSVSATRRKAVDFIEKIFPNYISIVLTDDSKPKYNYIETEYTISNVPKEYKLVQYLKNEFSVSVIWENPDGNQLLFEQDIISTDITIDNEHILNETDINGNKAYIYGENNNLYIAWNDGVYWYCIGEDSSDEDKIINYAKNISKKL